MQNRLPEEYIIQKFFEFAGFPVHKKYKNVYNACCPSCKEGKSWGRKKRLFYVPEKSLIHCHNCNKSWSPVNWVMEQTGMSYYDVLKDVKSSCINILPEIKNTTKVVKEVEPLPSDSINLFNETEIAYYDSNLIVKRALNYIKDRRLDTAVNRPDAFYMSLTDYIHKNRLVIPFYNKNNEVIWYQTRGLLKEDLAERPKYLSKFGDKHVFGLNKVTPDCDYIFVFEGPIDSMFCRKNGVAVCGINFSDVQEAELNSYHLYTRVWVLDNQLDNTDVRDKMLSLISRGERVFIWPSGYEKYKDVNDICVDLKRDYINEEFFLKNSYQGMEAKMRLTKPS